MLFDVTSATATAVPTAAPTGNGFSLFGMTTSDSINAVIALFAVLGFIGSMVVSFFTLKLSRKIGFYQERYDFYKYIYKILPKWRSKPENFEELFEMSIKVRFLFKRSKKLSDDMYALYQYYDNGKPLPDYRKLYKTKLTIEDAFFIHILNCSIIMRKQLL